MEIDRISLRRSRARGPRPLLFALLLAALLLGLGASLSGHPPVRADDAFTWRQLPHVGSRPRTQTAPLAAYDSANQQLIVLTDARTVWALSLAGSPIWRQLVPSGEAPPSGRTGSSAIYDSANQRLIIFGGSTGPYSAPTTTNDVWSLSLSGAPVWARLAPDGTAPPRRQRHTAVYDSANQRMIIFGGYSGRPGGPPGLGGSYLSDTWILPLQGDSAWQSIAPTDPPPAGMDYRAVADVPGSRLILIGRGSSGGSFGVWSLALDPGGPRAWTRLSPTGTEPTLPGGPVVYDSGRRQAIGLVIYASAGSDCWALRLDDPVAWGGLLDSACDLPIPGTGPATLADGPEPQLITLSQFRYSPDQYGRSVLALSLGDPPIWSTVPADGSGPPEVIGQSVVYDRAKRRAIFFGGTVPSSHGPSTYYNDVWELSLAGPAVWRKLTPEGTPPAPRADHGAVYDEASRRMVVYGGRTGYIEPPSGFGTILLEDVWVLSLADEPRWTQLRPEGASPGVRSAHAAVFDEVRREMVTFGGHGDYTTADGGLKNDVWSLSLNGPPVWTQLTPAGPAPAARTYPGAAYDSHGQQMIIFGGSPRTSGSEPPWAQDTWLLLRREGDAWLRIDPAGAIPPARSYHASVFDPSTRRLIIRGGTGGGDPYQPVSLDDLWALTLPDAGSVPATATSVPPTVTPTVTPTYSPTPFGTPALEVYLPAIVRSKTGGW